MSFTAQFNSLCGACEEWIRPGDEIVVTSEGSLHDACLENPRASVPTKPPCQVCWQIPASNGLCGCDDG